MGTLLGEFDSVAKNLQNEFERSAGVQHQGMKGTAREHVLVENFLRDHLPGKYSVGTGVIVDSLGNHSRQQDIVIYDGFNVPALQNFEGTNVFFVEQVFAVIEVKSQLAYREIKNLFEKARSVKSLSQGGRAAGAGIFVFGFAYRSKMALHQIGNYAQKHSSQLGRNWGIDAIAVLEDKERRTGLVTNLDPSPPEEPQSLEQGLSITGVETESQGNTLLLFFLSLMMTISAAEARANRPDYYAYATTGRLRPINVHIGKPSGQQDTSKSRTTKRPRKAS